MKLSVLFVLFATVFLALTSAFPTIEEEKEQLPQIEDETFEYEGEETGVRFQRATCDLLSVSTPIGSLNHAACAAHCLAMRKGFRGGRCRDGVCHCRR